MAWGIDIPITDLMNKLMNTRLRIERVKLLQKLQSLEERAVRRGLSVKGFKDLKKELEQSISPAPDRVDPELVLPRKPEGRWRRRYVTVRAKPGSVF